MRLPSHREMMAKSPAFLAEQFRVPKDVRSLDLLDGIPESPQEHPHQSRRKLRSLPECKTDHCSPDHLEMTPNFIALAPQQSPIRHDTLQVA